MFVKHFIRLCLVNLGSLLIADRLLAGVTINGGIKTAIYAAVGLTIIHYIIKPLIKLLLLPVNLITLGAFRWVINVLALYLLVLFVPQLVISSFTFQGFVYQGLVVPSFHISLFLAYVICSLVISFSTTLILWLIK
jgi:putative membrane protein